MEVILINQSTSGFRDLKPSIFKLCLWSVSWSPFYSWDNSDKETKGFAWEKRQSTTSVLSLFWSVTQKLVQELSCNLSYPTAACSCGEKLGMLYGYWVYGRWWILSCGVSDVAWLLAEGLFLERGDRLSPGTEKPSFSILPHPLT